MPSPTTIEEVIQFAIIAEDRHWVSGDGVLNGSDLAELMDSDHTASYMMRNSIEKYWEGI